MARGYGRRERGETEGTRRSKEGGGAGMLIIVVGIKSVPHLGRGLLP